MKQKLIALFLIIVMVASALTAVGLATTITVAAATATQTTLSVSKTNPVVGERVTFTVALKRWNAATRSYAPLVNKYVTLYHTFNGHLYTDVKKKTDTNGKFTFPQSYGSPGQRVYYAKFAGDSSYATSKSATKTVTVKYGTTLTLASVIYPPTAGVKYSLYGYLTDSTGKPMANRQVTVWWRYPDGSTGTLGTTRTISSGYYAIAYTIPGTHYTDVYYWVLFAGDSSYMSCKSPLLTLKPTIATALTINMGTATDGTNYLYGRLTEKYTGKPIVATIKVWEPASMSPWWSLLGSTGTNNNGEYTFSRLIYQGQRYMASYEGNYGLRLNAAQAVIN